MRTLPIISFIIIFIGCNAPTTPVSQYKDLTICDKCIFKLEDYYTLNNLDSLPSTSIGSPGNGTLKNAKILPPKGKNFFYFDSASYAQDRAFTHSIVREILLNTYEELDVLYPGRIFGIMEASNKNGGKMDPHRTHQNGMSIDLMYPKLKNNVPYRGLDTIGFMHYLLDFDDEGIFHDDASICIDFPTTAHHIYLLSEEAENLNYKIDKVIVYTAYLDKLLNTPYGKLLKRKGIYFAQKLSPKINSLHDDHFHVDFKAK